MLPFSKIIPLLTKTDVREQLETRLICTSITKKTSKLSLIGLANMLSEIEKVALGWNKEGRPKFELKITFESKIPNPYFDNYYSNSINENIDNTTNDLSSLYENLGSSFSPFKCFILELIDAFTELANYITAIRKPHREVFNKQIKQGFNEFKEGTSEDFYLYLLNKVSEIIELLKDHIYTLTSAENEKKLFNSIYYLNNFLMEALLTPATQFATVKSVVINQTCNELSKRIVNLVVPFNFFQYTCSNLEKCPHLLASFPHYRKLSYSHAIIIKKIHRVWTFIFHSNVFVSSKITNLNTVNQIVSKHYSAMKKLFSNKSKKSEDIIELLKQYFTIVFSKLDEDINQIRAAANAANTPLKKQKNQDQHSLNFLLPLILAQLLSYISSLKKIDPTQNIKPALDAVTWVQEIATTDLFNLFELLFLKLSRIYANFYCIPFKEDSEIIFYKKISALYTFQEKLLSILENIESDNFFELIDEFYFHGSETITALKSFSSIKSDVARFLNSENTVISNLAKEIIEKFELLSFLIENPIGFSLLASLPKKEKIPANELNSNALLYQHLYFSIKYIEYGFNWCYLNKNPIIKPEIIDIYWVYNLIFSQCEKTSRTDNFIAFLKLMQETNTFGGIKGFYSANIFQLKLRAKFVAFMQLSANNEVEKKFKPDDEQTASVKEKQPESNVEKIKNYNTKITKLIPRIQYKLDEISIKLVTYKGCSPIAKMLLNDYQKQIYLLIQNLTDIYFRSSNEHSNTLVHITRVYIASILEQTVKLAAVAHNADSAEASIIFKNIRCSHKSNELYIQFLEKLFSEKNNNKINALLELSSHFLDGPGRYFYGSHVWIQRNEIDTGKLSQKSKIEVYQTLKSINILLNHVCAKLCTQSYTRHSISSIGQIINGLTENQLLSIKYDSSWDMVKVTNCKSKLKQINRFMIESMDSKEDFKRQRIIYKDKQIILCNLDQIETLLTLKDYPQWSAVYASTIMLRLAVVVEKSLEIVCASLNITSEQDNNKHILFSKDNANTPWMHRHAISATCQLLLKYVHTQETKSIIEAINKKLIWLEPLLKQFYRYPFTTSEAPAANKLKLFHTLADLRRQIIQNPDQSSGISLEELDNVIKSHLTKEIVLPTIEAMDLIQQLVASVPHLTKY